MDSTRRRSATTPAAPSLGRMPEEYRFGANEVPDVDGAVKEIERYLAQGAVVIAEQKFGVDCDSPEMQRIYEVAEAHHVPVLMHWQFQMYNYGFERFYKMLEKYPRVNFIGHAQTWWANIDRNQTDQTVLYPKGSRCAWWPDGSVPERLSEHVRRSLGRIGAQCPDTRRRFRERLPDPPSGQAAVRQRLQRPGRRRLRLPRRTHHRNGPAPVVRSLDGEKAAPRQREGASSRRMRRAGQSGS